MTYYGAILKSRAYCNRSYSRV